MRIHKKCVPLQRKSRLGYGVMVTLQILVLPFLVRVRVAQQRKKKKPRSLVSEASFVYQSSLLFWLRISVSTALIFSRSRFSSSFSFSTFFSISCTSELPFLLLAERNPMLFS